MFSCRKLGESHGVTAMQLISSGAVINDTITFYALVGISSRLFEEALDSMSGSTAHFPSTAMQAVAPGFFNLVL